jgi:hypothetical protein
MGDNGKCLLERKLEIVEEEQVDDLIWIMLGRNMISLLFELALPLNRQ